MLKVLKLNSTQISEIVNLVYYSYNNENTRDNEAGQDIDCLRRLVVHYVACVFEIMARDDNFLALMEEGGQFVRDLTSLVVKRMD